MKKIIRIIAGASIIMGVLVLVAPRAQAVVSATDRNSCALEQINKFWKCTARNANGTCTAAICTSPDAQAEVNKATTETSVDEVGDAQTLLQSIIGWIQVFFYIIATLMIILAAWDYLNSHGSEDKVKEAKQRVIYAIVAIAIAVVAGGIVQLVKNFVG